MAIKYVENYRKNTTTGADLSDTETIQTAIDGLEDGDTLIFEQGSTYVLDKPIQLTSYKETTDELGNLVRTGNTRGYLIIDGQGCTIKNSPEFNGFTATYSNTDIEPIEAFFITSDISNNYIRDTHIKNFNFEEVNKTGHVNAINKFEEYRERYLTAISFGPSNPDPGELSTFLYLFNSKITNCNFEKFKQGINLAGEENTVQQCKFKECSVGINCDCTNQAYVHHNHFFVTEEYGIKLTQPYRTEVHYNYFYHCKNYFIETDGAYSNSSDDKTVSLSICSNTLVGGKVDSLTRNQNGICLNGVQSAMIKDNFIYDMNYLTTKTLEDEKVKYPDKVHGVEDDENKFGNGIIVDGGTNDDSGYRYSERVIVSGNEISGCMRCGIRTNYSLSCTVINNLLYSCGIEENEEYGIYEDYGIYIDDYAGDLHISDNALYYFTEDKFMRTNNYNTNLNNNTCYDKNKVFDPTYPARYIDTFVEFGETQNIICVSDLTIPLEHDEKFKILVPEDYSCSTVSYISYNGMTGNVRNMAGSGSVNLQQYRGQYVRMKYKYYSASYGDYIRFIMDQ